MTNLNDFIAVESKNKLGSINQKEVFQYDTIESSYIPLCTIGSSRTHTIKSSEGLTVQYQTYPFFLLRGEIRLPISRHSSGRTYKKFIDCFRSKNQFQRFYATQYLDFTRITHKNTEGEDTYYNSFHGGIIEDNLRDLVVLLVVDKKYVDIIMNSEDPLEINNYPHIFSLLVSKKLFNDPTKKNFAKKIKKEIIDGLMDTGINIVYTNHIPNFLSKVNPATVLPKLVGSSTLKVKKFINELVEEVNKEEQEANEEQDQQLSF